MSKHTAYMVGNTNGRDHIYFPTIIESDLIAKLIADTGRTLEESKQYLDLNYPVGFDLPTIMHIMWKVRRWKVEGSFTYQGYIDPDTNSQWYLNGTFPEFEFRMKRAEFPGVRDVIDEGDILGPTFETAVLGNPNPYNGLGNSGSQGLADEEALRAGLSAGDNINDYGQPPGEVHDLVPPFYTGADGEVIFSATSSVVDGYVIYDPGTAKFWPTLNFFANCILMEDFGVLSSGGKVTIYLLPVSRRAAAMSPPPTGTAEDVQQGTLTIVSPIVGGDAIEVPIGMHGEPGGPGPNATFRNGTGNCDLTLTPIEWWPYKNSQGDPVYDTATGAQLVDPFS